MHPDGSAYQGGAPPSALDGSWGAPPGPGYPSVPTPRLPDPGPAAGGWPPQQSSVPQASYPGTFPGTSPGSHPGTYPGTYPGTVPGPPSGPPPVPPSGGGGGSTRGILIGVLVAVVLLAAGGGAFWFWSNRGEPADQAGAMERGPGGGGDNQPNKGNPENGPRPTATGVPGPTAAPAPTAQSPSPAPTTGPTAEEEAVANLERQRAADAARVPLDGRWVAQVASKYVGISDPLQTAANGSHTFYATDIWIESRAALAKVSDPSQVYLLTGTDFGRRSTGPGGVPFWITVVDGGFGSEADVDAWCAAAYPELNAEQLENACTGRTLSTPHD